MSRPGSHIVPGPHGSFPPGRLITGPADVVHGTNFVAPPNPRSVISVQDLSPIIHPEWCRPEVRSMVGPLREAIRRGATIHASSQSVADAVETELRVDPERIALVHHAVAPLEEADGDRGRSLAGSDRYVLVLGTVETRKDVAAVTDAVDDLPDDVRVVVAGPVGNAESSIDTANARITRLPSVDTPTRAALIRGASVLAYPSRYEGFGLPPLEALSVGVPTVATAVGALPELVGDEIDLVPTGDRDRFLASLLVQLESPMMPSPTIRDRIAAMSWDRAAETMVTVYRRVGLQTGGDPASR